jgi:AraC-like DNA-binding protein
MVRAAEPSRLAAAEIRRHYHPRPYATLVLEGSYEEAGDQGRYRVESGDLLLHPAFSAHRDLIGAQRTYVLDIDLPFDGRRWPGMARVADPDTIIRTARRDAREAQALLLEGLVEVEATEGDPADHLAAALNGNPSLAIGEWAAANGFSREWLSRRFQRFYEVSSSLFRAEARSRRAWQRIVSSGEPLALIAADCGFADQAHMTRSVGILTGRSPGQWRAVTSVQ